ncbi:hypothetical protein IV454_07585 [Massilia antarctica]|uniref:DUF2938 domain-containing protein n=1 Tax=Massilia antarctica TaxID=2765360 RepID=A0AA48WFF7_9BURK|nr:hypothetical protein [Massilia antarctica]QPI51372.1 hypothetical protein IV454_07585 [Massilia antarctica]
MDTWKSATQRGLVSGATASLLSTAALAALGELTDGSSFGPTNAISHWLWGDKATRRDGASLRYTLTGYLIHHASATFWAVLFERLMGRQQGRKDALATLQAAAAASAVACFVDYQITPERLKPGFETRLSRPSLALVYAAFGLGLAAGALLLRRD